MNKQEKREFHSKSSGVFFEIKHTFFKKKSRYQEIEVIDNPYFGRMLFLDGLVQTTEKDEFFYHEMLVHPALVTHPNPQQILIIGGGDRRTEVLTAEGKKYLATSQDNYDIVFVDSSEPVGPSKILHERSFFELVRDRLAPSGIVCAQMGAPFFQMESMKRAKDNLKDVFEIVRFYLAPVPTYPGGNWCYVYAFPSGRSVCVKKRAAPGSQVL
jgi:spermidine synthase